MRPQKATSSHINADLEDACGRSLTVTI